MAQKGVIRPTAVVSVVQTRPGEVSNSVRRAMEMADWRGCVSPGADVSLKVNLGWDKLIPGAVSGGAP